MPRSGKMQRFNPHRPSSTLKDQSGGKTTAYPPVPLSQADQRWTILMNFSAVLYLTTLSASLPAAAGPDAKGIEFFEKKIRPVLVRHCYDCHSTEAQKNKRLRAGLLLDSREGLLEGGNTGPAIVPGKPDRGMLLRVLRYDGEIRMPPKGKLPAAVLADFESWVKRGAPDP